MTTQRLFIGLSLPEEIKMQLAQQQAYLGLVLDESWFKFSSAEQQHLTLLFLGYVDSAKLSLVKQSIGFACRNSSPFELTTAAMGAFPSLDRPSILWTGVAGETTVLASLRSRLVQQLEGLYKAEHTSFKPHLTLARVKTFGKNESISNALLSAPSYPNLSWLVDEVILYSSSMTVSGHEYKAVFRQPLGLSL